MRTFYAKFELTFFSNGLKGYCGRILSTLLMSGFVVRSRSIGLDRLIEALLEIFAYISTLNYLLHKRHHHRLLLRTTTPHHHLLPTHKRPPRRHLPLQLAPNLLQPRLDRRLILPLPSLLLKIRLDLNGQIPQARILKYLRHLRRHPVRPHKGLYRNIRFIGLRRQHILD
jgi:hypothetical protein